MFSFLAIPFLGSILAGIAAILTMIATFMQIIQPILTAIVDAIVWFVKQFIAGLGVIFTNLSTLAVLAVLIIGVNWYTHLKEAADCREEVDKQRKYDHQMYEQSLAERPATAVTTPIASPIKKLVRKVVPAPKKTVAALKTALPGYFNSPYVFSFPPAAKKGSAGAYPFPAMERLGGPPNEVRAPKYEKVSPYLF